MKREFSEELVSAYLDGELTADEQSLVEAALRNDAELRAWIEDNRRAREQLQRLPRVTLDQDFASRVLRAAERQMLLPSTMSDTHWAAPDATHVEQPAADLSEVEQQRMPASDSASNERMTKTSAKTSAREPAAGRQDFTQSADWARQQQAAVRRWRLAFAASSSLALILFVVLASQELRGPSRNMGLLSTDSRMMYSAPTDEMAEVEAASGMAPDQEPLSVKSLRESTAPATASLHADVDVYNESGELMLRAGGGAELAGEKRFGGLGGAVPGEGMPAPGFPGAGAGIAGGVDAAGMGGGGVGAADARGGFAFRSSPRHVTSAAPAADVPPGLSPGDLPPGGAPAPGGSPDANAANAPSPFGANLAAPSPALSPARPGKAVSLQPTTPSRGLVGGLDSQREAGRALPGSNPSSGRSNPGAPAAKRNADSAEMRVTGARDQGAAPATPGASPTRGVKPLPQSSLAETEGNVFSKQQSPPQDSLAVDLPTDPARLDDVVIEAKRVKQPTREAESLSLRKAAERQVRAADGEQPTLLMVRLQLPETAARNRVLARGFADNGLVVEPQVQGIDSPDDKPVAMPQSKPATDRLTGEKLASEKSEKSEETTPTRGERSKVAANPRSSPNAPQNGADSKDKAAPVGRTRSPDSDADAWSRVQLENSGDYAVFFLQATPEQLEGLVEVVQRETEAVAEQQVTLLTANNRASAVTLYNNYSEPMSEAVLDDLVDSKGDRSAEPKLRRGRERTEERELAANSRASSTPYDFSIPTQTKWRWLAPQLDESAKQSDPDVFLRRLAGLPQSLADKSRGAEELDKNREESIAYPVLLAVEVVSDRPARTNSQKAAKEESPEDSSRTDAKPSAPKPEKPAPEKPDSDKPASDKPDTAPTNPQGKEDGASAPPK
ncbi:MAG: zf-HC2 domain-containing protein [Pirellulales bacterium]